jgi:hypothetical protein
VESVPNFRFCNASARLCQRRKSIIILACQRSIVIIARTHFTRARSPIGNSRYAPRIAPRNRSIFSTSLQNALEELQEKTTTRYSIYS